MTQNKRTRSRTTRGTQALLCLAFLVPSVALANEPPIANDQSFTVRQNRDNPLNIYLEVDEAWGPGPRQTVIIDGPEHGTLTQVELRKFEYRPDTDYFGPDSFNWRFFDGEYQSNVATASIYVNQVPIAHDQDAYTLQGDSVQILLDHEDDEQPGPMTIEITRNPEYGTLELGAFPYVTYTPHAEFTGTDDFSWLVDDGMSRSNWGKVTVAVNQAPVASDRDLLVVEGLPLEFRVQYEDRGPLAELNVSVSTPPTRGELSQLTSDGRFSYVPQPGFTGLDTFTYRVNDGFEDSNEARVTFEVSAIPHFDLGVSFPLHGGRDKRAFTEDHFEQLNVRHNRMAINWSVVQVEEDGPYDWSTITKTSNWQLENGYHWTLTIQANAPGWACDVTKQTQKGCVPLQMSDFRAYVRALLTHLMGENGELPTRIQFGNEWGNSESENRFYPGTREDFVTQQNIVHDEVKAVSPSTEVVIGGLTGIGHVGQMAYCEGFLEEWKGRDAEDRERYCSQDQYLVTWKERSDYVMENSRYDVVDLHLYTVPETWRQKVLALRNVIVPWDRRHLPVIASEFGGPNQFEEPIDEAYQEQEMHKYLDAIDECGLTEALFFKLVESGSPDEDYGFSGLISRARYDAGHPNPEKLTYWVFQDFNAELVNRPYAHIDAPQSGDLFTDGAPIRFIAQADDRQDGNISSSITWTSDRDGWLGAGAEFVTNTLSLGVHTITASVTDTSSKSFSDSIVVTVGPAPNAPLARNDAYVASKDDPLVVPAPGVLDNDRAGQEGILTAALVTPPIRGTVTLRANGGFTYVPNGRYVGVDRFTYEVIEAGIRSAPASVVIEIVECAGQDDLDLNREQVDALEHFKACQSITAGDDFVVGNGGTAVFSAGSAITLTNGFSIESGGALEAEVTDL